ncbi:MAG: DedA family protein [Anaerolineae bacterium]
MSQLVNYLLHLDAQLAQIIAQYGTWTLAILFVIIFLETGVVIAPFLPGDSLIFAAGAFAARGALNPWALLIVLSLAAILGDTVNYWIGYKVGAKAYSGEVRWIKKDYMVRTHNFFEKYGGKAIFLARFVPIVRTFAPFAAGVSEMSYPFFLRWNIIGGIVWVALFTGLGYFFGNIPFVQKNFELVIVAIILISVVPAVVEIVRARMESRKPRVEPQAQVEPES